MMNFGYRNELRRHNARIRAERRDALVFKAAMLCAVAMLLIGAIQ